MDKHYSWTKRIALLSPAFLKPSAAFAHDTDACSSSIAQNASISGLWILANLSYAGMRAQNHPNLLWRSLAFLAGLPGTALTYFVVVEGSNEAYGIYLSTKEK